MKATWFLIITILLGCSKPVEESKNPINESETKKIISKFSDELNNQNLEGMKRLLSQDFQMIWKTSASNDSVLSLEEYLSTVELSLSQRIKLEFSASVKSISCLEDGCIAIAIGTQEQADGTSSAHEMEYYISVSSGKIVIEKIVGAL